MTELEHLLRTLDDDPVRRDQHDPAPSLLADRALHRARRRRWAQTATTVTAGLAIVATVATVGLVVRPDAAHRQAPAGRRDSTVGPFAGRSRMNLLLLGGDSGLDRIGIRPDSILLASTDVRSGDTALIGLPRNLTHVPFPPGTAQRRLYPNGFSCMNPAAKANTECLLNGLWTWGEGHPQYYPGNRHPGLTATVQGVEQVTGLHVDEYAVLNLKAFTQVVDALGGVTVTVRQRLPMGGSVEHPVATQWLMPGRQHLNGYQALWYARSRWSTDDYDRMARQRCLVSALVGQLEGPRLLTALPKLLPALRDGLITSIPLGDLPSWVELFGRVQHARVIMVGLTPPQVDPINPDFTEIHQLVARALAARAPAAQPAGTPSVPARAGSGSAAPAAAGTPGSGSATQVRPLC